MIVYIRVESGRNGLKFIIVVALPKVKTNTPPNISMKRTHTSRTGNKQTAVSLREARDGCTLR